MTDLPAGRDLDALVAEKVMGWKPNTICRDESGESATYEHDYYWRCHKCGLTGSWGNPGWDEHVEQPLPYSTSIDAAWAVVEKLAPGWELNISNERGEWKIPFWECELWEGKMAGPHRRHVVEAADTPMLAICRAALAAVTEEGK